LDGILVGGVVAPELLQAGNVYVEQTPL